MQPITAIVCKLKLDSSQPCLTDEDINSSVVSNQQSQGIYAHLQNLTNKCDHEMKVHYGEHNPNKTLITLCANMHEEFKRFCATNNISYTRQGS